jgi:hypothetical protein
MALYSDSQPHKYLPGTLPYCNSSYTTEKHCRYLDEMSAVYPSPTTSLFMSTYVKMEKQSLPKECPTASDPKCKLHTTEATSFMVAEPEYFTVVPRWPPSSLRLLSITTCTRTLFTSPFQTPKWPASSLASTAMQSTRARVSNSPCPLTPQCTRATWNAQNSFGTLAFATPQTCCLSKRFSKPGGWMTSTK